MISAANIFSETISVLASSSPAITAAAAKQLGEVTVSLYFGDGSDGSLLASQSRLLADGENKLKNPKVELYFDDHALAMLFDASARPSDQVLEKSLDMRGKRDDLLAVWRCFQLLSQRASGLRAIHMIWSDYRNQTRNQQESTTVLNAAAADSVHTNGTNKEFWPALSWLNKRHPAAQEIIARDEPILMPARLLWDGGISGSWQDTAKIFDTDLQSIMQTFKTMVADEILELLPTTEPKRDLYDLMADYVTREGKGLRPTLVIATCLAFGGGIKDAVRSAAALEMFHNGFLVHDDIADESTHRRGLPTLHEAYGAGLAVNTGDAMHMFAVDMTLSNLKTLGLARTLAIIQEILFMCRETVEGQALELGWIRYNEVPDKDDDYFVMSNKKTGWYTCISPCRIGACVGGCTDPVKLQKFDEAFRLIGIAFQIQDDILNLVGETELYGKEVLGDLLEGKRTIMMIHLFNHAKPSVVKRMTEINAMPRADKEQSLAEEMLHEMHKVGSIEYATALADKLANQGVKRFEHDLAFIEDNEGKALLRQVANYVTTRAL